MTEPVDEPRNDLDTALAGLRETIRRGVSGPDAAVLRARAQHQLRVRRITTAGVTTGVVLALALGGNALVQPITSPPIPPAASPTETPPTPPTVAPSPRPSPVPPEPLDDPIVDVDWRNATIAIPPAGGCPQGPVTFIAVSDIYPNAVGPTDSYPRVAISATNAAYGDLTGDGRAEAVISAGCFADAEDSGDGKTRLLVVAREPDGALTGMAWVGPPGADFQSWWLVGNRLLVGAGPGTTSAENQFPHVPGLALAYQWDGQRFTGWEPAPEYPPAVPVDSAQTGAPVRLGPAVASGLGCPDVELRLTRSTDSWIGSEGGAGTSYTIPAQSASAAILPSQQFLFDLDHTGDRLLVTSVGCALVGGSTSSGLAVFERAGDGWQGISLLTRRGHEPQWWWMDSGRLSVEWLGAGTQPQQAYEWTGTVLEPVDG
ncbi:MAG: hypothetical protein ACRDT2_06095 [Natronosporangium sp.]